MTTLECVWKIEYNAANTNCAKLAVSINFSSLEKEAAFIAVDKTSLGNTLRC